MPRKECKCIRRLTSCTRKQVLYLCNLCSPTASQLTRSWVLTQTHDPSIPTVMCYIWYHWISPSILACFFFFKPSTFFLPIFFLTTNDDSRSFLQYLHICLFLSRAPLEKIWHTFFFSKNTIQFCISWYPFFLFCTIMVTITSCTLRAVLKKRKDGEISKNKRNSLTWIHKLCLFLLNRTKSAVTVASSITCSAYVFLSARKHLP